MLVVLCLVVAAAVIYYFGVNRILGLPQGPPPLPLIGNMLSFRWEIDEVLLDWKTRYGSVFTVWLPYPIVVICDHKVLHEHVVKQGELFIARKNPEQLCKMWLGGLYGLGFQDNSMVKEQRSFARKSLHEIGFGSDALEDLVYNYALEVVLRWMKSSGQAFDIAENIEKAIGNTVWNIIFGISLDFDNEITTKFRALQLRFLPLMAGPQMMFIEACPPLRKLDFLFGNKMAQLQSILDEANSMIRDAIRRVQETYDADSQPNSYVEAFLREMKRNEENGKPEGNYHYQQMHASAFSLWSAGFDTTVGILRLCCLELINHADVQKNLQKEIDDVIGKRRITFEDRKKLPYMCAFIQEVYRIGNVLPMNFLRQTVDNTVVDGHHIPLGTNVLPQFSVVHSDPNEFERPDYFCPERHINDQGQYIKDPRITPFSIGRRACLGETLARMEVFVILATMVQNCNFTSVGKVPPPVKFTYGLARTVDHFLVKIEPRT